MFAGEKRSNPLRRSVFGSSEVQHLPLLDEILDRTRHVFDRHARIDPVLVIKVDAVGPESLERGLDHFPDVLRPTVETTLLEVETELCRDDDLVPDGLQRFSNQVFVRERTVDFGGIEERDAFFVSCTNDFDALVLGRGRSVVGTDAHAASTHF
jgi:hypothetical protein